MWDGRRGRRALSAAEVTGTDAAAADLTSVSINRPCYLADTQSGTVDYSESLDLAGGNEFTVNGDVYVSSTTYLDTFAAGSLVELDVSGIQGHPFHLHVNPYQVVAMDADDTTYFQVGDWHDTVYDGSDESTVRFYTDNFVGKMVVHCHVLEHEDQGMMGLYEISGTAGTTYADAETLDPTCYRGAGGRGYTVSDDDGAAASDDTVTTSSAARHGGPAAAALVALASSALVVALAMMN